MHIVLLSPEHRADAADPGARRRFAAWSEWPGVGVLLQAARQCRQQGPHDLHFTLAAAPHLAQRMRSEWQRTGVNPVRLTAVENDDQTFDLLSKCDACVWHAASPDRTAAALPDAVLPALALNVPVILAAYGPAVDTLLNADAGLAMVPGVADSLLDCVQELRDFPHACRGGREWLTADPQFSRRALVAASSQWLHRGERCGDADSSGAEDARRGNDRPDWDKSRRDAA